MKAVICTIARLEHNYINEWCNYYIGLGFNHIYLYDNDDPTDPYIGDFIDKKLLDKITIINIQGRASATTQVEIYKEFYAQYRQDFDWCLFCDIDEFLVGIDNINDFLSQDKFKQAQQIQIKWRLFGDDGVIERDMSIPVHEFFKIDNTLREPVNRMLGKMMLKNNIDPNKLFVDSCHYCRGVIACYPSGRKFIIAKRYLVDYPSDETVWLNHYRTKTLKEFLETKLVRQNRIFNSPRVTLKDYFFGANEWTQEKQNFIDKWIMAHPEEANKD